MLQRGVGTEIFVATWEHASATRRVVIIKCGEAAGLMDVFNNNKDQSPEIRTHSKTAKFTYSDFYASIILFAYSAGILLVSFLYKRNVSEEEHHG